MMTIKKNTRYPLLRYALIIPLVIFISLVMMAGNPAPIQTGSEVDAGPHYKEGQQALMIYLQSNIRYPQSAREQQLQSTVYVSFDVSASGEVENVSVTEAIDETMEKLIVVAYAAGEKKHGDPEKALEDLQKESIRVVNGLGNFEPAMRNNTPVKSSLVLSVKFVIQ